MTDGTPTRCVPPRLNTISRRPRKSCCTTWATLAGKTFQSVQIDSWEINIPNWSQTFLADFRRLRGYDAQPYLAALSGNIVGSAEITDRFLHDYRKTLADCVAENYFGRFTALAHAGNCLNQSEAAGPCYPKTMPLDSLKNLGRCDIPMGEFWQDGGLGQ